LDQTRGRSEEELLDDDDDDGAAPSSMIMELHFFHKEFEEVFLSIQLTQRANNNSKKDV
jgi:hypothetical protein